MSEKDALLQAVYTAASLQSNDWSTVFLTVADYFEEHGGEGEWNLVLGLRHCVKESKCPECVTADADASLPVPVPELSINNRHVYTFWVYCWNVRRTSLIPSPSRECRIMRYDLIELLTEIGWLSTLQ